MSQPTNDSSCLICFDNLQNNISVVPCRHAFHDNCIRKWIRTQGHHAQCPVCRLAIKERNILGPLFATRDTSGSASETTPAQEVQLGHLRNENNMLKHQLRKSEHDRSQLESQVIEQQKRIRIFTRLRDVTAMDQNLGTPSAQNRMNRWRNLPRDDLCILLGGLHDKLRDSRLKEREAKSLIDRLYARINTLKAQYAARSSTSRNSAGIVESSRRKRRQLIPEDDEETEEQTSEQRPSKIIHISDDDNNNSNNGEAAVSQCNLRSEEGSSRLANQDNTTEQLVSIDDDTTDDERGEIEGASSSSASNLHTNSRSSGILRLSDEEEGFEEIPTITHYRQIGLKRPSVRPLDSSYQTPFRNNAIGNPVSMHKFFVKTNICL
ncbi:hypothetical protein EC973_003201 [Apophysomyces ossiformis]|uniref:RING-type domain-containing protein n=1 Tax=Apophysomyces ossiformis TaxID=679940 RepID=A0A8H7BMN2_9FUNG|nr:hypothetical protein EC973_003201 [Apophysomyces ossiformis]